MRRAGPVGARRCRIPRPADPRRGGGSGGRAAHLRHHRGQTLHLVFEATISVSFLPHVLCILAFLPIERLGRLAARWRDRWPEEVACPLSRAGDGLAR
jgi:hypothetical protein